MSYYVTKITNQGKAAVCRPREM